MAEIIKTTGIVIGSRKHTIDAARMLTIFSPELGRFSAVIRGVEKPKAKLASASQPFCFGEFMLAEKNGFYTVTDCYIYDSFFSLAYNLDSYVLGSSMLEVTGKLVQEGESNLELFTLLLNCLKVLAYEKAEPTGVAIKFLMETLKISGFGFDVSSCEVCHKSFENENSVGLVYTGSGAVCTAHKGKTEHIDLSYAEWQIIKTLNETGVNKLGTLRFHDRESLTSSLSLLLKQFYYRTGEKINSLQKYF